MCSLLLTYEIYRNPLFLVVLARGEVAQLVLARGEVSEKPPKKCYGSFLTPIVRLRGEDKRTPPE